MIHPQIVGWAHSKFGRAAEQDLEQLIAAVVPGALTHAKVGAQDIDGVFVGVYNNGFSPQAFEGSLVGMAVPELSHVPAVHLENACATGSLGEVNGDDGSAGAAGQLLRDEAMAGADLEDAVADADLGAPKQATPRA